MRQSLIGVFGNLEDAVEARQRLREEGFADTAVRLHRDPAVHTSEGPRSDQDTGSWLRSLFSLDEDYVGMYTEAVQRGHHLLAVDAANEQELDTARRVMEQTRCIDIERDSGGLQGSPSQRSSSMSPETAGQAPRSGRARVVDRI
jgi:hypothetical protein